MSGEFYTIAGCRLRVGFPDHVMRALLPLEAFGSLCGRCHVRPLRRAVSVWTTVHSAVDA